MLHERALDMANPVNRTGGLQSLVLRVRSSFQDLTAALDQVNESPSDFDTIGVGLHDEGQRFDLWSRNLGAYQSGHASLEYRFRDAPKVYEYAQRLLSDLCEALALSKSY